MEDNPDVLSVAVLERAAGMSLDGDWVAKRCPRSHVLNELTALEDFSKCTHCQRAFLRNSTLLACHVCNYYFCRRCDAAFVDLENSQQTPRISLPPPQVELSTVDKDSGDGISDAELHKAFVELSGMLEGRVSRPQGLRRLSSGTMGNGGTWELNGEVDPETGMLQLFVEGHFGVPLHVMQKCLLDEAFQKTYDPFLVRKVVVKKCGRGGGDWDYHDTDTFPATSENSSISSNLPVSSSDSSIRGVGAGAGDDVAFLDSTAVATTTATMVTSTQTDILHHEIKIPRPFSNRDYAYFRRSLLEPGVHFTYVMRDVVPKAANTAKVPLQKGVVRAGNGFFWQLAMGRADPPGGAETKVPLSATAMSANVVKRPPPRRAGRNSGDGIKAGKPTTSLVAPELGRCVVVIRSQDNLECRLPKWMQNFAAKTGAPRYMKQLEEAALLLMVQDDIITKQQAQKWC